MPKAHQAEPSAGASSTIPSWSCRAVAPWGLPGRPDWIAGVSIGAINAALIAGHLPDPRVKRLREFWERVSAQAPICAATVARSDAPTIQFHECGIVGRI
ncbi:patatin-like phospholipase family protein [Paraburkholderia sediminicola]